MSIINYAAGHQLKLVYYGPGMAGKTANLQSSTAACPTTIAAT